MGRENVLHFSADAEDIALIEGLPLLIGEFDVTEGTLFDSETHPHPLSQHLAVEQIAHPDAETGRLVRVGRADPPAGGADPVHAQELFHMGVKYLVVGHDEVGALADHEIAPDVDSVLAQGFDLLGERHRIEDNP